MYADVLKRKAIKLDMNVAVTVSVMLLINHLQLYLLSKQEFAGYFGNCEQFFVLVLEQVSLLRQV